MCDIGEVIWVSSRGAVGREQKKDRPILVIARSGASITGVPLTSAEKKGLPTHVAVGVYDLGVGPEENTAICEHACSIDRGRILRSTGTVLPEATLRRVVQGLHVSVGLTAGHDHPKPDPARGAVLMVDWQGAVGAEPQGSTLAVVVQNNVGNHFSPTTIVVPLLDATRGGVEVQVRVTDPKERSFFAALDGVREVDKKIRLGAVLTSLPPEELKQLDQGLAAYLSLNTNDGKTGA